MSLLPKAVEKNNTNMVSVLLQYGADPNTGLQKAVDGNKTEMALLMLNKGALVSDPKLIAAAASKGNTQIAERMLSMGADANNGMLPAIKSGKSNMFDLLVTNGAVANKLNYTVAAVSGNHTQIFKKLMDAGAPVEYTGNSNKSLLHISCQNKSFAITEILIQKGLDVNQKTSNGDTPLHVAANSGRNNTDLCKLLVDSGADVNAANNRGKTVLKVADGRKLKDYLKSVGAKK